MDQHLVVTYPLAALCADQLDLLLLPLAERVTVAGVDYDPASPTVAELRDALPDRVEAVRYRLAREREQALRRSVRLWGRRISPYRSIADHQQEARTAGRRSPEDPAGRLVSLTSRLSGVSECVARLSGLTPLCPGELPDAWEAHLDAELVALAAQAVAWLEQLREDRDG